MAMKKMAAIAALAGALLLSSCAPPPAIDKDAVFLKLVHDNYKPVVSDSKLMEMAKAACATLKDGYTKNDVEQLVAGTDQPQSKRIEMATIIGYGIGVYCPEFS